MAFKAIADFAADPKALIAGDCAPMAVSDNTVSAYWRSDPRVGGPSCRVVATAERTLPRYAIGKYTIADPAAGRARGQRKRHGEATGRLIAIRSSGSS